MAPSPRRRRRTLSPAVVALTESIFAVRSSASSFVSRLGLNARAQNEGVGQGRRGVLGSVPSSVPKPACRRKNDEQHLATSSPVREKVPDPLSSSIPRSEREVRAATNGRSLMIEEDVQATRTGRVGVLRPVARTYPPFLPAGPPGAAGGGKRVLGLRSRGGTRFDPSSLGEDEALVEERRNIVAARAVRDAAGAGRTATSFLACRQRGTSGGDWMGWSGRVGGFRADGRGGRPAFVVADREEGDDS